MNKKLFGTLLLGSLLLGGTFVSCKDYDDDIDNLQSQVDALKSSAALKTDVDGLKSSLEGAISSAQNAATAAKAAADAAEKKANEATSELAKKAAQADLEAAQAKLAAAEEKLAKLEAAIAELDGLEAKLTEATAAEFDKMKKEFNAEFADIKSSVEAMLESLNIVSLSISKTNVIANGNELHWGVATKDIEWAGPKGNISKGDLLVGLIEKTKYLTVVPATVDLEGANIELVNSLGEAAPVSITATPASKSNAGVIISSSSRAADIQGKWNLDVAPAGVDATTIADAYAVNQGTGKNYNVRYAVSVDGRVVTGYDYEVSVEKAACTHTCTAAVAWTSLKLVDTQKMNAGTANVYQVTNSLVYDSYLTFDGNDAERAEDLGITVEGMTVVIPEGLTSRYDLYATLHVIDLKGNISKSRGKLVQVDYDEETDIVAAATIKPSILKKVEIPLGTVLKNLSDTDAKQVKNIAVSTKKAFIYGNASNVVDPNAVGYLNSYDEPVSGLGTSAFDVRTVRTLTINPSSVTFNGAAGAGKDTLKVDLMGNSSDIIKTIYVPIEVVKPTGAELAAELKVTGTGTPWSGDVLNLKYDNTDILAANIFKTNTALREVSIEYTQLSSSTPTVFGSYVTTSAGYSTTSMTVTSGILSTNTLSATTSASTVNIYDAISTSNPAKEWKLKTGSATFKLAEVAAWTFTYNFDINMVDVYAGYSLKWFKNVTTGTTTTVTAGDKGEIKKADGIIFAHTPTQDGIAWQHSVAGVPTEVAYSAAGSPLTGIATTPKVTVTMYDPANTIKIGGMTATAGKYTLTDDSYTFGNAPADPSVSTDNIATAETEAKVDFAIENSFGVVRTISMQYEFK